MKETKIEMYIPEAKEVTIILDEKKGTVSMLVDDKYNIEIKDVKKLFHQFVRRDVPSKDWISDTDTRIRRRKT